MKIINEELNLKLELNSDTQIDLNNEELLQLINYNMVEIDNVAKLKIIRTLFETEIENTKEDLIIDIIYFLHHMIK